MSQDNQPKKPTRLARRKLFLQTIPEIADILNSNVGADLEELCQEFVHPLTKRTREELRKTLNEPVRFG